MCPNLHDAFFNEHDISAFVNDLPSTISCHSRIVVVSWTRKSNGDFWCTLTLRINVQSTDKAKSCKCGHNRKRSQCSTVTRVIELFSWTLCITMIVLCVRIILSINRRFTFISMLTIIWILIPSQIKLFRISIVCNCILLASMSSTVLPKGVWIDAIKFNTEIISEFLFSSKSLDNLKIHFLTVQRLSQSAHNFENSNLFDFILS